MKLLKVAAAVFALSAWTWAQASRPQSCTLSNGGTCRIGNANGAYGASFEEIPAGSPSSVSVTIQGCMQGDTCDTAADTNTSTSAVVRGVTFPKVYDYFLVTATLGGGTSPTIKINSIVTTANAHSGGGGGCIATVSTLSTSCGTKTGTLATVTDGSTTSDCTVGGGTNVVACQFTGSAWVFAGSSGSAPTFAQVLTGTNVGQTFTTGTGGTLNTSGTATVDFSTLGTFKVPSGAGAVATATKMFAFDSTASALHGWNGADSVWPKTLANSTHKWLNSFTQSTGAFTQTQPASADLSDYGSIPNAALANAATTVNGQACTLGSTCSFALNSAGFANQGTTTTVLHGNAAGNPAFGAVALTTDVSGALPIANGGTAATTAAAGFDALAPTTTRGDIIARGATSNGRVAIGTLGSCLTSNGTDPVWGSCATGSIGGSGTANTLTKFSASATVTNSTITDDGTTVASSATGGLNLSAGPLKLTEITAPTGSAGAAWLYADSTAHRLVMKNAGNTAANVVASGVDVNTSDQVTATHLAAALPVNQGGSGTTSTLTGIMRGGASAMTAAELSADVTTSGSNAATVVALRGAALPTLAASTGLLFDTAGTLSLPATLPASSMPALTGDVTNTLGSLATTVGKINGTAFAGTNGNVVKFGAANTPADSAIASADLVTYHTPAAGIARTASGSQAIVGSELSGDAATSGSNAVTVNGLKGAALPTLAASTGLLFDTAGTLSLPATLPTSAFPALTGDVTNSAGALATTVGKINGNSVPSGAAANQLLIGTAANTFSLKTVPDCVGGSNALNYAQATFAWTCLSIATLSNPMTTLGDMIYGGSAGAVARLGGPTSGNSPYTLISAPSGGAATAPAWSVSGVPVDAQSGSTFTIQSDAQTTPDRAKIVNLTNNTTSTAVTVPQAGSAGMLTNFPFGLMNTGAVVATATPTTSTVNGNTTLKLVGAVATHNPEMAFWWSDALSTTGNWWAAEILPTDANGLLGCEGFPALTGDVTGVAGTCGTTVTKINGTAFAGTNGHLVAFGAANVPGDSNVVGANVVTAASNYTNGDLVQAAGANKTTSDSGIATASVVTAASNYTSGGLVYAAAANKTTTNSADWAVSTHTLSGGSLGIFDVHALSATAGFLPPSAAGAAPTTAGVVAFDTTNNNLAFGNGTTTNHDVYATGAAPGAGVAHFAGSTYAATSSAVSLTADVSGVLPAANGGTGVNNTATLTLGSSNRNYAALGTGIEYNTTTTGAVTNATGHNVVTPLNCADSSGSGTTQVCNTSPSFTPAAGDCMIYTTTTANTGAGLTINWNSLGARSVAKYQTTTALAANDVRANTEIRMCYDGTNIEMDSIGNAPSGTGTVTSIATTSPITGGTITTTGTIACATCVTSAASLTAHAPMIGEGSQSSATAASAGTAGQYLRSGGASADGAFADFPDVKVIPAANCNNATAGAGWSIGSGGTVGCRAGTNNLGGFITITDTASTFAQFALEIPADWDTGVNPLIRVAFASATDTTNGHTVIPQIKVSCPTAGNGTVSDDATFSAAQSLSTTTFGASAVANGFYNGSTVQIGSTQMSGCIAGGLMIIQIGRATDTATGNINFYNASVTFPRLLTVQAN